VSLTVIVTRDVEPRYRGFLASAMLEVAPTVYIHPRLSAGVRDRIWLVLADWYATLRHGAIVLAWADPSQIGGIGIRVLGLPPRKLAEVDGLLLVKRELETE
jgi:CRISPR-associated protein Cas2